MEIKTGISLQTKQQLSQLQVESLNILAMSMTELKDFLQNEEIEIHREKKKQRRLPIKRRNGFTMVQTGMREGKMSCTRLRTARNHWKTL